MFVQKITILLAALLLSFFQTSEKDKQQSQSSLENNPFSFALDSLNVLVKTSGWNTNRLANFHFNIINSVTDSETNLQIIKNLPGDYEKSFLYSLVLKKQQKFNEMYDTLYGSITYNPSYSPFYEELVFAASASNRIALLESRINAENNISHKKFILGLIYSVKSEYGNALAIFKELAAKDSSDKYVLLQLSNAFRSTGDYQKARDILINAGNNFPADKWFLTKTSLAEGSLFFLSGDYDNAKKLYNKGYQLALAANDKQNQSKSFINLGIVEDYTGDVEKARELFAKAITTASLINDYEILATAYSELGVSYTFTNNLIEAKINFMKSQDLFEKLGNRLRLSYLLNNIGKIYAAMFDYRSALKFYENGIQLGGDDKRSQVMNLIDIADVYANLSNYTKALQYYRDAQKISSEIKDISLESEINYGLGSLNFNLDRFENALSYYNIAKEFALKTEFPSLVSDINHKIGLSYLMMDSLSNAEKFLLAALDVSEKNNIPYTVALASIDLASLLRKEKDFNSANKYVLKGQKAAGENGFTYLEAKGKLVEGEIAYDSGNFFKAENLFKEAGTRAAQLNEFRLQSEAYYLLGKMFHENGFFDAAKSYYLSAFDLINDISRPLFEEQDVQISYFSAQKEVYESLANLYLKQNKFKEAFEIIDKSRSRNMVQNLNNLKLQALLKDETSLDKIYEYEWIVHSGIYNKEETDSVKNAYNTLKEVLVSGHPELAQYLYKQDFPSLPEVQKNLNVDENLLSFFTTENETYLFLITKNNFRTYKKNITRSNLLKLLNDISPHYDSRNAVSTAFYNQDLFSFNANAAYKLYDYLLKDVLRDIPEQQKIIVTPSTELISVPFDFLVTSIGDEESSYSYYNKDYLIYKYNISYIPSAAIFLHQRKNTLENRDKILVVGNPTINSEIVGFAERRGLLEEAKGLPRSVAVLPLKYSEEEVNQITTLINADKVLLKNEATETRFKEDAEFSKIIHLSTHSFLFNKQPVIFFSNYYDPENDGFLEAGEIVQLKLNSDLVVLSSCNSGLGTVDEAEGIIGMTKAFFEAGTKSVVVSLWEVNDKYTARLMTLFYKKLSEGIDKDEALRQAKIDFIKQYSPNPYYWSAFVFSGNAEPVVLHAKVNIQPYIGGAMLILILVLVLIIFRKRIKNSGQILKT
jgi:CHAT domain-containing protein/lipopolysaccharide biosynthesis regulator YciM